MVGAYGKPTATSAASRQADTIGPTVNICSYLGLHFETTEHFSIRQTTSDCSVTSWLHTPVHQIPEISIVYVYWPLQQCQLFARFSSGNIGVFWTLWSVTLIIPLKGVNI